MRLRRAGSCAVCSVDLAVGVTAAWFPDERVVRCVGCVDADVLASAPGVRGGEAGGSARREHERRARRREEEVRRRHPRIGGLLLALTDEPSSTKVWAQGAAGEEAVGSVLDGLAPDYVTALHDRKMRDWDGRLTRANIDHLAVAARGVWVVDAKTRWSERSSLPRAWTSTCAAPSASSARSCRGSGSRWATSRWSVAAAWPSCSSGRVRWLRTSERGSLISWPVASRRVESIG
jgi:hypothetical protein